MTLWAKKSWASENRRKARLMVSGHLVPRDKVEKAILEASLFRNPSR